MRPKPLKKPGPETPKSEKPLGKIPEIFVGAETEILIYNFFKIHR